MTATATALKPLAVDYSDVLQGAQVLEQGATDLRTATLGHVPNGFWVYGDPFLAVCVAQVTGALRDRQEVLATESARIAADLRASVQAYQDVDTAVAEHFDRLAGRSGGGGSPMEAR